MATTFSVKHKKAEFIVPSKPTPKEKKQLSDIDDQESQRYHIRMIMLYKNSPSMEGKEDPVRIIKEALTKTLVYYYPFTGRLIEQEPNGGGKLMVDCSNEVGVIFVEADADVSFEQLGDWIVPPCPFPRELLYDGIASPGIVGCPLMSIQVTRFICGGFALAIRLNHVISDGVGLVQFLNAVAEMARGASTPRIKPVWRRELLTARDPPRVTCTHHEFDHDSNNISINIVDQEGARKFYKKLKRKNITDEDNINLVCRSFFFGPDEIAALRKHLQPHLRNSTKFEVITACVWRSRTKALQLKNPNENVRISSAMNVSIGKNNYLNLPRGYYGNAAVFPAVVTKANMLCEKPLGFALEEIKKAKAQVNEEYVRSVIDFMAIKGRPPLSNSWNFIVSNPSIVGFDEIDFGWGKPIYGGTMDGGTSNISIYARYRNSKGEVGILVPMCLPKAAMERFEDELKKLIALEKFGDDDLNPLKTLKIVSRL